MARRATGRARGGRGRGRPGPSSRRRRAVSRSPKRLVALFLFFVFAFLGMTVRLVTLQVVDAPAYARLAADQREREVAFPARRGAVFDRDGEPLAISVDMRSVFADPQLVEDPIRAAQDLASVLPLEPKDLIPQLQGTWPGDRFELIARHVEPKVARLVKELDIPGIYMQSAPKRYYPNASLGSHVLGFVDIDGKGLSGIELQHDEILRGRPGRMSLEQDPAGRPLPQAEFSYVAPTPGRSLFLTIDKDIQYVTEEELAKAASRFGADGGTAIVMRPATGEILALANIPEFDPNRPGDGGPEAQRNRALTDMYEPGSAFKIVTVSGALEEKVVRPKTTFVVPDSLQVSVDVFHDSHPHPAEKMNVEEIIQDSSNVGTIKIGLKLGKKKMDEYVRRFGFGAPTGLDFPGEAGGIVLDPKEWSGVTIATVPIGQGISVTPLQMTAAYAALANRGAWVEPKLTFGSMDGRGGLERTKEGESRRVVSARTANRVVRMLTKVVEDGTGVLGQVPGYKVAGKTGTAQKPLPSGGYGNSYVASFAGFTPVKDPAIVVLVVLDEPRPIWGGHTAAPTFQKIAEFTLRHLGIPPHGNAARAAEAIEASRSEQLTTRD